ncbi:MAG: hypothetical protein WD767_05710 [Alphaproteobacteria bacterium]
MSLDFQSKFIAPLFVAALALTGCETTGTSGPDVAWAGIDDAAILLTTDEFANAPSRHVVFTDMWQREEYALFQGEDAQSEIILSVANERDTIVLNYGMTIQRMVETWNIARNHGVSWGAKGQLGTALGSYFYQHFRLADNNRPCVGFANEWDARQDDPDFRNSKVLFGYSCGKVGGPAYSEAQVANLLDNIRIRGITTRRNTRFQPIPPQGANRAGALAFAQGSTPDTGNAHFPFNMAYKFTELTGDDIFPK